jgi:hypothetical protein
MGVFALLWLDGATFHGPHSVRNLPDTSPFYVAAAVAQIRNGWVVGWLFSVYSR